MCVRVCASEIGSKFETQVVVVWENGGKRGVGGELVLKIQCSFLQWLQG